MLKKGKRKKKESDCSTKSVCVAFPPLFRVHSTTPKTTPDAPASTPTPAPAPAPVLAVAVGEARPTMARVLHELRLSLGMIKNEDNERYAPDPGWSGHAVMNPLAVNMRQGGPVIGGPGFWPTSEPGAGGRYDFGTSPGLGFRSQTAWRVWKAALDVMERDKTLPPAAIFQAATARAGIRYGQIDPAEARLLEMGIEWYTSNPSAGSGSRDMMGKGPGDAR